ncbi:cyclase family protein [Mesorhizobium retamae]|uniref:Cyclase family protein n=1 Tax=Mesorhizobium retamae TaxID=2912854 RepID=A0ABS9QK99_9HYPH|nr:cyclase family protein [Mesorhizobium sp. IRAMC:0171]MCG7507856.1 cyclase family protein [Mesorhizobium sp. IRAMC:0171]
MIAQRLLGELASLLVGGEIEVLDLTAVLGPKTPVVKLPPDLAVSTPKVEIHTISTYDKNGPWWAWNWLKLGEHSGTHFDAPIHWISGKEHADGATDTIPVSRFVGPVNVIDCSKEATADHDFLLTVDHIKAWEKMNGEISRGDWVLMRTDWYKRNGSEAEFLNSDESGPHSPGPTAEAIQYLIDKGICGWGSETISTDAGQGGGMEPPYPAHTLIHKANKYGLACLCNLDRLPARGAILIVAPLKIQNGTGSPIRAMALTARQA